MRILITGATGNVGKATIDVLLAAKTRFQIVAGLRDVQKDKFIFDKNPSIELQTFDFEKVNDFRTYLKDVDVLFLLRPPQIADTKKYFQPLIDEAVQSGLQHIVFLSVQGAEKNSIIPHNKIENMIMNSGLNYTFLRPAYFMQNFTTTLRKDILQKSEVYLPAGSAKFTIIDVNDIGHVAAEVLLDHQKHQNRAYELTNDEKLTFQEMVNIINKVTKKNINFRSPNLLSFMIRKSKEGVPLTFIFVMIMLHYFPRFQATPKITDCVFQLVGKNPSTFQEFVEREMKYLTSDV